MFLCVQMGALRPAIQRIIIEVMQNAYVLSTFYRELPFQV
jgi:hypothetical protein